MKQIIHIVKKDLKRFSWEIIASLALLALYGWCQPASWQPPGEYLITHGSSGTFRYLGAKWLWLLLILAWMTLLVRMVQEESPAGDRQFWVTRPYRWSSLLAAKALLFLALVNIPLLMVQLFLLAAAGFPPFQSFGRLLLAHLMLLEWLLPVGALAVVAAGRTQISRMAIVALLFLIAWGLAGTIVADFSTYNARTTGWDWAEHLLLAGIFLAVIVRQYIRRRTVQARWILVGGVLAVTLLSFAEPKNTLNEAEYPLLPSNSGNNFQVRGQQGTGFSNSNPPGAWINFSLLAQGVPAGQVVLLRSAKATFEAPDGTRWSSGWLGPYDIVVPGEGVSQDSLQSFQLFGGSTGTSVRVRVDSQFFERNKDTPVKMHLDAAAALFRDHESPGAVSAAGELQVPGVGACVIEPAIGLALWCRSTLAPLPLLGITARMFKQCPPDKDELAAPLPLNAAWTPGDLGSNGHFDLSSVRTFIPNREIYDMQARKICRESTITLHRPELIQQFRVESDTSNIKLSNLAGRP